MILQHLQEIFCHLTWQVSWRLGTADCTAQNAVAFKYNSSISPFIFPYAASTLNICIIYPECLGHMSHFGGFMYRYLSAPWLGDSSTPKARIYEKGLPQRCPFSPRTMEPNGANIGTSQSIWLWINTYKNSIFRGMDIHKSQLF